MLTQREVFEKLRNDPSTMSPTKITAFLDEFPWVHKYVGVMAITNVYVSRLEPVILSHYPFVASDSFGFNYRPEKLWLLDSTGEIVRETWTKVVRKRKWLIGPMVERKQRRTVEGIVPPNKTVERVLAMLGPGQDSVHFVLSYFDNGVVIIYKTPKNVSLMEWIAMQIATERDDFQKTCAEIDAEASR